MTTYYAPNYYGSLDWPFRTTTAINQLLQENARDGDVIVFGEGVYSLNRQISWSNKTLHIIFERGSIVEEIGSFSGPLIYATNADDTKIDGLTIRGSESAFDGIFQSPHYAIEIELSDNIVIENLSISNKSRGALIDRCDRFSIENVRMQGMIESTVANNNYHTCLEIESSNFGSASRIDAFDIGSCVLQGQMAGASTGNSFSHVTGINCFDNFVYISGGLNCAVSDVYGEMTDGKLAQNGGAVVKARGIGHRIINLEAYKTNTAVTVTCTSNSPLDAYGAKGYGNRASDCIAIETVNSAFLYHINDGLLRGGGFHSCEAYKCVTSGAAFGSYNITNGINAFVYNCLSYEHQGSVAAINDLGTTTRQANNVVIL